MLPVTTQTVYKTGQYSHGVGMMPQIDTIAGGKRAQRWMDGEKASILDGHGLRIKL